MKKTAKIPFRVTVSVDATKRIGHDAFDGVVGYIREKDCGWVLHSSAGNRLWLPRELENIPPGELDGVISFEANTSTINKMRQYGVCWVSIFDDPLDISVPAALSDNAAIGRLAGRHLLELQLKHFVYYGTDLANNSASRFKGFMDFLGKNDAGKPAHIKVSAEDVMRSLSGDRHKYLHTLGGMLLELTHDGRDALGVFAYSDNMGINVIDACRIVGLAVPDNVAVIAVATDEIICELSAPPLTTILQDAKKIGREAAFMLDMLLRGKKLRKTRRMGSPLGVKTRASTDIFATDDPYVIKALQIIRARFRTELNVPDILDVLKISRRLFEKRFRLALGRSPYEEITRLRIRHAEALLVQTSDAMPAIAARSGFASERRFRENFMKLTGLSPSNYRRKLRGE